MTLNINVKWHFLPVNIFQQLTNNSIQNFNSSTFDTKNLPKTSSQKSIYRDSCFSPNSQYSVRCRVISVDHHPCYRNVCDAIHDADVELDRSDVLVRNFPLHRPGTCTIFQTISQSTITWGQKVPRQRKRETNKKKSEKRSIKQTSKFNWKIEIQSKQIFKQDKQHN